MRNRFERQLRQLNDDLLKMGASTERAIEEASRALTSRDEEAAHHAVDLERELDSEERGLESLCLKLLLEQQPVAGDLRLISAALKMITDMERIGDQAADIAEIVLSLREEPSIEPMDHLPQMAAQAAKMVTGALDAFVQKDLEKAKQVFAMDDSVDELFNTVKQEVIAIISQTPENGCQAVDLIMIAKYFERIGDHAQNIAEWVIFSLTGNHKGGGLQ